MKNLLITVILVANVLGLRAQNVDKKNDIVIHIKFESGWGSPTYIDIAKNSEKVIISSPHRIKVKSAELHQDPDFSNLKKLPSSELGAKYQALYDKYSVFDTIKVNIDLNKDTQYKNMLKLITNSSKATLERNHEKRDIVMDVGDAFFTVITNTGKKDIQASGLFKQRYPILTNFVEQTDARLEPARQKSASLK